MLKSLQEDEQRLEAKARFEKLSQTQKLQAILSKTEEYLSQKRFKLDEESRNNLTGVKTINSCPNVICCLARASFNKSDLQRIKHAEYGNLGIGDALKRLNVNRSKTLNFHIFCCCLRTVPDSRIQDALPYFRRHEYNRIYSYWRTSEPKTGQSIHVHFLDGIDSLDSFCRQWKAHFPLVGKLADSSEITI